MEGRGEGREQGVYEFTVFKKAFIICMFLLISHADVARFEMRCSLGAKTLVFLLASRFTRTVWFVYVSLTLVGPQSVRNVQGVV